MKFQNIPYERLDFEAVCSGLKEITERAKNAENGEALWAVHQEYYELFKKAADTMTLAAIRHDCNTADEFYNAEKDYYDEVGPEFENLLNHYRMALYHSPHRAYMEEKIGKAAFVSMENAIKSMDEKIIGLMQEQNVLTTEYAKLIASAKIAFDGEERNLSQMRPFLTSCDREVRKEAWKAYSAWFCSKAEKLDELFDKLVANRTQQAKEMGHENYIPLGYYRMNRNSYSSKDVANFRRQVKEVWVPLAEKVHERRRQRLGLEKLSYIDNDMYFVNGNPTPTGTPEEILKTGQMLYSELSQETREFMDFMMENELFDVFGRKNKRQGGYMTYLFNYGSPFIFANFNGTAGDVDVITHECGHAFQGYLSGKDPIMEHAEVTMETAEVHSMSMEFFTDPWMKHFFGDRSDDFLSMQLEDAICFIPYGTMVDEFQHIIYENPQLTPQERRQVWTDLEKVYKPHLDYENDPFFSKGGFWQKQAHIYDMPFYYIDYVLAQTCAFQYKAWMDENYKEAWESYLEFCRQGGFFTELIKKAGLKNPFEDGYFEELVQKLEKMLEMA